VQVERAWVLGDVPPVGLGVELVGVADVVPAPHVRLDPEELFGVAEVGPQLVRDLAAGGEQAREGLGVGGGDGIVVVDDVEGHVAVVCVDRDLDRITDVVEVVSEPAVGGQP